MIIRKLLPEEKDLYNSVVKHPLQSWQWGEFKQETGMKAVRLGMFKEDKLVDGFQVLIRSLPKLPYSVGQLLKSSLPNEQLITALADLAREEKIIFIKIEPDYVAKRWQNIKGEINQSPIIDLKKDLSQIGLLPAVKPLFDPHSFVLDLTRSEQEIIDNMHPKTRYNIRLAEKKGVVVEEKSDKESLEIFIKIHQETMKRQGFYMHSPSYYRRLWENLSPYNIPHLLLAKHESRILAAWMLFIFNKRLFYPYGASINEDRNLMPSNLLCYRAILFGKEKGCQSFDMWGSLGPAPDPGHPWFGFHRFKLGYGGDLVESIGSWDLVANRPFYHFVQFADKIRWKFLRAKRRPS